MSPKEHKTGEKLYTHSMSVSSVREFLRPFGLGDSIIEFPTSSATVKEAAEDLGTEEGRIAKTMSYITNEGPIVIVVAGDTKISNRKYKDCFHQKARMIKGEDVEALTGHPVGGVCPFALPEGVRVYLDVSLNRFPTVFPACGSINSAIELTPERMAEITKPTAWVDVTEIRQ